MTEPLSTHRLPLSASSTLPGWVTPFYTNYKGKREGPYYARVWKKNGKQYKEYIKPRELEKVRAACEANRQRRRRQIQCGKELTTITGNLNYLWRMVKRSIKGNLRPEDHNFLAILETSGTTTPGRPSLRARRNFMVPSLAKRGIGLQGDESASRRPPARTVTRKPGKKRNFMVPSLTKREKERGRPRPHLSPDLLVRAEEAVLPPSDQRSKLGLATTERSNNEAAGDLMVPLPTTTVPQPPSEDLASPAFCHPLDRYDLFPYEVNIWDPIHQLRQDGN